VKRLIEIAAPRRVDRDELDIAGIVMHVARRRIGEVPGLSVDLIGEDTREIHLVAYVFEACGELFGLRQDADPSCRHRVPVIDRMNSLLQCFEIKLGRETPWVDR
jgi:hypothetical protein